MKTVTIIGQMSHKKNIPFIDLKKQYLSMCDEINTSISRVLASGRYILGKEVKEFECEFASYSGCSYGIGVSSGTEALQIALLSCGLKPKDEVITVANAGVPMIAAITMTGAIPVFVDIDPGSYLIDSSKIEEKITRNTKAILPVHLYGQCVDMKPILAISKKYGLWVIEDACQAHGASYRGKKAGAIGDMGCFSFYPTKNLGCYGDGGIIITSNQRLADQARMLREYGQTRQYHHLLKGLNSRLDEIQAAILRAKLKFIDRWNIRRNKIAEIYDNCITNKLVTTPRKAESGSHVYHLYVISCGYRDVLTKYLDDHGVHTIVHYPIPAYRQRAYEEFRCGNGLYFTEKISRMVLSLPLYPEMEDSDAHYICRVINEFKAPK